MRLYEQSEGTASYTGISLIGEKHTQTTERAHSISSCLTVDDTEMFKLYGGMLYDQLKGKRRG